MFTSDSIHLSSKVLVRPLIADGKLPSTASSLATGSITKLPRMENTSVVTSRNNLNSTEQLIDDYIDCKSSQIESHECIITHDRKQKTITVNSAQLRDPKGNIVTDINSASFVMVALSHGKKKSSRSSKTQKLPKPGAKTFGNEHVPRISSHLNPLKNYMYCQFLPPAAMAPQTVGQVYNWSWTISLMPGIASYTSLYDQYCVRRIEVWFIPNVTETTNLQNTTPLYYIAYDPDGSTNTTASDLQQYDDCVICNVTTGQYVCFTPSIAVATYGGAFTKYSFEFGQWCDVANTDISQYGLTGYIDPVLVNGDYSMKQEVRMWVEFRGVR